MSKKITNLAGHNETELCDCRVVPVENASFNSDVSRGSPLVEVGRATAH